MKTIAVINGTHCNSCKMRIEDACKEIKGVISCSVDIKTGVTAIEHNEQFDADGFKHAIEQLGGYNVEFKL